MRREIKTANKLRFYYVKVWLHEDRQTQRFTQVCAILLQVCEKRSRRGPTLQRVFLVGIRDPVLDYATLSGVLDFARGIFFLFLLFATLLRALLPCEFGPVSEVFEVFLQFLGALIFGMERLLDEIALDFQISGCDVGHHLREIPLIEGAGIQFGDAVAHGLAPDAGAVHAADWVHLEHVGFFVRKKHSWVLRGEGGAWVLLGSGLCCVMGSVSTCRQFGPSLGHVWAVGILRGVGGVGGVGGNFHNLGHA